MTALKLLQILKNLQKPIETDDNPTEEEKEKKKFKLKVPTIKLN
jgi:hypothetical protein